MKDNNVYIYNADAKIYNYNKPYHPGEKYPEYPFPKYINKEKNEIYDAVRETLHLMKLDEDNYGKKTWNPFKNLIKKGDTVLIKPNMVLHESKHRLGSKEALITNGNIIRAILDYVYIALSNTGKIIIADAPVQGCDFNCVIKDNGTEEIVGFYNARKINVSLLDFRQHQANKLNDIYVQVEKKLDGDPIGYRVVNVGDESAFKDIDRKYIITNYSPDELKKHHNKEVHEYLVPQTLLEANVIINLPKPKTHRKAGITGALKNMVGISGNKAWLPHHSMGSLKEKGDEYAKNNFLKRINARLAIKRDDFSLKGNIFMAKACNFISRVNRLIIKRIFRKVDSYSEGSWWGNDTIWRTIDDLNKIVFYANKEGVLQKESQRKMFVLADMIISGEKEGPLHPSNKEVGLLVASSDSLNIDVVLASIMGFDCQKIPTIINSNLKKSQNDIKIISNDKNYQKTISEFTYKNSLKFIPSDGWKGHIEKQ